MRDEQYFPNPDVFSPERHLDKVKGSSDVSTEFERNDDPSSLVFGFGRRYASRPVIYLFEVDTHRLSESAQVVSLRRIQSGLLSRAF